MADEETTVVSSPEKVRRAIQLAYQAISGEAPDRYGIAERFWSAVAHSLFSSIFIAFLAKSRHERDELGFQWIDHKPRTKAYSRPDARRSLSLTGPKRRPTLSDSQDRAWRGRFRAIYARLAVRMTERDARAIAAASAWNWVKDHMGAETLLSLTRGMLLPILNRTGTLQRSLFPAPLVRGSYRPIDPNQVYRPAPGSLEIGTRVPYTLAVDRARPVWPKRISLWLARAVQAGRDAVLEYLPEVLQRMSDDA